MMSIFDRIDGDLLSSSKTKAALAWEKRGGKIVALNGMDDDGKCTCGRKNCKAPGKHPLTSEFPRGQHRAIKNKSKIRRVFKKHPDANLAVVLPKGIVVLDVDGKEGRKTYKTLKLPRTAYVTTGRGKHYYLVTSTELPDKLEKFASIDIKDHDKGYIVVPPSRHHSGARYKWGKAK